MRSIPSLADHTLRVVQPEFLKFRHEIRFGEEKIGSLAFPKSMSRICEMLCAEGHWTIDSAGGLKSDFLIKTFPDKERVATYHPKVWSGKNELQFPDGRMLHIQSNFWRTRTGAYNTEGIELLRFETEGVFKPEHLMIMNRTFAHTPQYSLIALVTLYIHVSPAKHTS